ncbi:MAG: hypothetical protein ACOH2M_30250 [Cypionkella sp.]
MRYAATALMCLISTIHPTISAADARLSGSLAVSGCVEKHSPKLHAGVKVTMDQAILQIAVNYTCATVHLSEHQISRLVAECVLDGLFLGMRTADYASIDTSCRTGRESEQISSYFYMNVCMMKAMEDGLIVDQESALSENSYCEQIVTEAATNPDYKWDLNNR